MNDNDGDLAMQSPPVAIIGDEEVYDDPMQSFPYHGDEETLLATVKRLKNFLHYGEGSQCGMSTYLTTADSIETSDAFDQLREWIEKYLTVTKDRIDGWYEDFVRYREFWLELPVLIHALSWRTYALNGSGINDDGWLIQTRRFFGQFLQKSRQGRASLTEFLCQFARLTGRFVTMDVRQLSLRSEFHQNDQVPEVASRNYLAAYSHLLRKDEVSHLGGNLERHYNWDWDSDVELFTASFESEGGSVSNLTRLVHAQLDLMTSSPRVIETMVEPCRLVAKAVQDAEKVLEKRLMEHTQQRDSSKQQIMEGYKFFEVMSAGLNTILEKHVTFLTPESVTVQLDSLQSLYLLALRTDQAAFSEKFDEVRFQHSTLLQMQYPKFIALEWKFVMLKKLITSVQMQLRVAGVTGMCNELLHLYNTAKGADATRSPLLLSFADFILHHKVIDYIVGTAPHPEIINESHNIVSFLIVTQTYQPQQTDTIWHTVKASQDPRVVDAVLRMVRKCSGFFDYHTLLYVCQKVNELPIEAFTGPLRDLCHTVFTDLVQKLDQIQSLVVDAPPYELCVRLIRQSSIITADLPIGLPEVQHFAAEHFRQLLFHGPASTTRNDIYLDCISDISDRSPTAPGSICVINTLLSHNLASDLKTLTFEHGLTKLVVDELESTLTERTPRDRLASNSPASLARRDLLSAIIIHEPGTITPELGTRLWDLLVGSGSGIVMHRDIAWHTLNSAVKKTSAKNVFISTCFREYLPKLSPECFTPGALDFAREAIMHWLAELSNGPPESDLSLESPAMEQLWRMILTAPPNTIDAPAINILVEVHVANPLITSLPRADASNIHLALVRRCLKQLAEAATNIRASNDEAPTSEDEGMVIVPSETPYKDQERYFARSLAVLREFLAAYQSKPQFATPKLSAPPPATSTAVEGEPLTVKYQSFDDNKQTEVKDLTVGTKNNAASLLACFQKATGFEYYKVFYRGQAFDATQIDLCKSLDDLNLNGLFLIQRRSDAEGNSISSKSVVELEITKHFNALWEYLGMQNSVAQEVHAPTQ